MWTRRHYRHPDFQVQTVLSVPSCQTHCGSPPPPLPLPSLHGRHRQRSLDPCAGRSWPSGCPQPATSPPRPDAATACRRAAAVAWEVRHRSAAKSSSHLSAPRRPPEGLSQLRIPVCPPACYHRWRRCSLLPLMPYPWRKNEQACWSGRRTRHPVQLCPGPHRHRAQRACCRELGAETARQNHPTKMGQGIVIRLVQRFTPKACLQPPPCTSGGQQPCSSNPHAQRTPAWSSICISLPVWSTTPRHPEPSSKARRRVPASHVAACTRWAPVEQSGFSTAPSQRLVGGYGKQAHEDE